MLLFARLGLRKLWLVLAGQLLFFMFSLFVPASSPAAKAQNYPLRSLYPSAQIISTDTLVNSYAEVIIIDVRTAFEFDVVHINKAVNISLVDGGLVAALERYRAPDSTTPLVFYCNDPACSRAFRAALAVQSAGYGNVFVYDAGVFSWVTEAPEKTTLMGSSPAHPEKVISPLLFERHQLDFESFEARTSQLSTLVVDIRDIYHRNYEPRIKGIRSIPLESFLEAVTHRIWAEKKLLIFDQSGEQTRWLQYFLQASGYADYAFLSGGMDSLNISTQAHRVEVDSSEVNLSQQSLLELTMDAGLTEFDKRLVSFLVGYMRFENYSVIDEVQIQDMLDTSSEVIMQAALRLRDKGYLLFSRAGDVLVFHLNPRLAWKGEMEGDLWRGRVREFDVSVRR